MARFSQAASSCSDPITLTSCIARARHAGTGLAHDLLVDQGVHLEPRDQPAMTGSRMSASIHSVRSSRRLRPARVEAGDVLDARVGLEPFGEQRAELAADAGDEHPAARH